MGSEVYVDGVDASTYLREIIERHRKGALNRDDLFWSCSPKRFTDPCREIFQVEFAGPRPVNHISFKAARFPHYLTAEWWDPARNEWRPLRQQIGKIETLDPAYDISEQREKWEGPPVTYQITDSRPRVISQADDTVFSATHPQHYGTGHWVDVKWKVVPVNAKAIRVILVRALGGAHQGFAPVNSTGREAPYSLAVKDFSAGFRVYSKDDIPASGRITLEEFGSSTDLMGTPITYRLKENAARNVLSPIAGKHWKSEPQPVNYAVVNFYADVRTAEGEPQTIDRFYLDPLTVGPTMNIYYTSDDPDSDFAADDSPLTYPIAQSHGDALEHESDPLGNTEDYIHFSDTHAAFVDVDNAFLQWDPQRPWWLGMAITPDNFDGVHPLASFAGNTLRINSGVVEFVTSDGFNVTIPLPERLSSGSDVNIAAVYTPYDADIPQDPPRFTPYGSAGEIGSKIHPFHTGTISLLVGSPYVDPEQESQSILTTSLGERPEVFSVGRYSTFSTPGVPAFGLRALTLKIDEIPPIGVLHGFLSDPHMFVMKPEFSQAPDMTTNSLLRMHPRFATPDNVSGAVGGPGDRYDDAVWTPVSRDFSLRQGFVRIPPTRAKHFKFEFTNLVHETYESFIPIRREVRVYPASVVEVHSRTFGDQVDNIYKGQELYEGGVPVHREDSYNQAPGVRTQIENADLAQYADAIAVLSKHQDTAGVDYPSKTEAYVSTDPAMQEKMAEMGWIWSYTPWHLGSSAPKFTLTQKHSYEKITVDHHTKTAFFVGLRRLDAYRVNYATDDDTDIYYDYFLDEANLVGHSGIVNNGNGITAISSNATVTSNTFPSTRMVRGLQFATVQTDNIAMLPDDGFIAEDLEEHWDIYGDATLTRVPGQGVRVNRGWFQRTYGQVEAEYGWYGNLEGLRYGEVEGSTSLGVAGGGIVSEHVSPSQSGRIYAAARITAVSKMAGPVRLEIVSVDTGRVLSSHEVKMVKGEVAVLRASYGVGSAQEFATYGDLEEHTYGDLDGQRYSELQTDPIGGDVFVRLYQTSPSQDEFMVHRLSLFDAPVAWRFSVDGGGTWTDAMDIRNNPEGVLTFPEHGNALQWRATIFHPSAEISALAIRPWYGGLLGSLTRSSTDYVGPNRSVIDDYPDVDSDPLWQQSYDPIPQWWYDRDVASIFGVPPNLLIDGEIVVPMPDEPPTPPDYAPPVEPEEPPAPDEFNLLDNPYPLMPQGDESDLLGWEGVTPEGEWDLAPAGDHTPGNAALRIDASVGEGSKYLLNDRYTPSEADEQWVLRAVVRMVSSGNNGKVGIMLDRAGGDSTHLEFDPPSTGESRTIEHVWTSDAEYADGISIGPWISAEQSGTLEFFDISLRRERALEPPGSTQ